MRKMFILIPRIKRFLFWGFNEFYNSISYDSSEITFFCLI
jgi:hypothetical protein